MKTCTRSFITSLVIMSFLLLLNTSCRKSDSKVTPVKTVYTIAVISDTHYLDPSLVPDTSNNKLKIFRVID